MSANYTEQTWADNDSTKPLSAARMTHLEDGIAAVDTAAQTAAAGLVPNTRTVAGHALTSNVSLVKADVGLGNVDNTSDVNKPVSTAQATADTAIGTAAATDATTKANSAQSAATAAAATDATTKANAAQAAAIASANTAVSGEATARATATAAVATARAIQPVTAADNSLEGGLTAATTSVVGTGEIPMTVGIAGSRVRLRYTHYATTVVANTSGIDTPGSTTITFRAAIRDTAGTIWPLTFGGQRLATLDGGGDILSDPLGLEVAAGDLIYARTYLASGTAYNVFQTQVSTGTNYGGFTSATDLTAAGSAAVTSSTNGVYAPVAIHVLPDPGAAYKSVLLVGDSVGRGRGDGTTAQGGSQPTRPWIGSGGFMVRALTGKAGISNICIPSDQHQFFETPAGHVYRMRAAQFCNYAIDQYGTNDIYGSNRTPVQLQTNLLARATYLLRYGIRKTFVVTLTPQTTSTDNWLTVGNQTVLPRNANRVIHNNWVRDGGPIDTTTLLPVATGTVSAYRFGAAQHPIAGYYELADSCESARDSGAWKAPVRTVTDGVTTSGSAVITSATAAWTNSILPTGDIGRLVTIPGAGAAGAVFQDYIKSTSGTSATVGNLTAGTTIASGATIGIGCSTADGIHPAPDIHYAASLAVNLALMVP